MPRDFTPAKGQITKVIETCVPEQKSARNDGTTYRVPWDVAKVLYPEVKPFIGWGPNEDLFGEAPLLVTLLGEHMKSFKPGIMQWAVDARNRMLKEKKGESIYTGDADYWLTMIEDTKNRTIFEVSNSCTCSLNNAWYVIWEHNSTEDVVHVRAAWDVRGKQEKQQVFDDGKPTKRYFKKTNWATPYRDMRDPGFICTHRQYKSEALKALSSMEESADRLGHYYNDWKHAIYNLHNLTWAFKDEPEND